MAGAPRPQPCLPAYRQAPDSPTAEARQAAGVPPPSRGGQGEASQSLGRVSPTPCWCAVDWRNSVCVLSKGALPQQDPRSGRGPPSSLILDWKVYRWGVGPGGGWATVLGVRPRGGLGVMAGPQGALGEGSVPTVIRLPGCPHLLSPRLTLHQRVQILHECLVPWPRPAWAHTEGGPGCSSWEQSPQ